MDNYLNFTICNHGILMRFHILRHHINNYIVRHIVINMYAYVVSCWYLLNLKYLLITSITIPLEN